MLLSEIIILFPEDKGPWIHCKASDKGDYRHKRLIILNMCDEDWMADKNNKQHTCEGSNNHNRAIASRPAIKRQTLQQIEDILRHFESIPQQGDGFFFHRHNP